MGNNPFQVNKNELVTGFYYDKRKLLICFLYNEENPDDIFSDSPKIYSRIYNPDEHHPFIINPHELSKKSSLQDLVTLTVKCLSTLEQVMQDFEWIYSNKLVRNSFVEFLLKEEKYLILDLFKTFIEVKKE